jgi:glycosyltransferase involved in cell wall biosynthesis
MPFEVLVVIEAEIATTQLVEQVIGACGPLGISSRTKRISDLRAQDISSRTLPLFIRCADPSSLPWAKALVGQRRPFVYYLDDNFWELDGDTPLTRYYSHPSVRHSLDYFVANASVVLTSSKILAEVLRPKCRRVVVVPTFFDFSLVEDHAIVGNVTAAPNEQRVGFVGNPSRVRDLEVIAPVLQPLLDRFPDLAFEFFGVLPPGVQANDRIRRLPQVHSYRAFIQSKRSRGWTVGLAPLRNEPANRSKTDNKYREYAACRVAGIYSNVEPYRSAVIHNATGLLVENSPEAWLSAIAALLTDSGERERLVSAAYLDAREKYDLGVAAVSWGRALREVADASAAEMSTAFSARRMRMQSITSTLASLWVRAVVVWHGEGARGLIKRGFQKLMSPFVRVK